MRSSSSFSLMARLFVRLLRPLAQTVAERDAFVEHKALPAPTALPLRHVLEISENAALEVIDLGKAACEQMRARLLAADAAGAEHRDPAMLGRIEMLRGKVLELAKALDAGIDRALERAHRHLEGVAGIEQERVGLGDHCVPFGGLDIGADLPRRVSSHIAERHDLPLEPHLEPAERHRLACRELQFEIVEPAAEHVAVCEFMRKHV